jgi:hypothetical protein
MALLCESCQHWIAVDRLASYAAPCALKVYDGRVPFDLTCDKHSSAPAPAVDMQSQARGVPTVVQMWTKAVGGTP